MRFGELLLESDFDQESDTAPALVLSLIHFLSCHFRKSMTEVIFLKGELHNGQ